MDFFYIFHEEKKYFTYSMKKYIVFDQWGYPMAVDLYTIEELRKIPKYMEKTPDILIEELCQDGDSRLKMLPHEILSIIISMKIRMEISDHKKQWIHDNYMCNICEETYWCFIHFFCCPEKKDYRDYRRKKKFFLKNNPHEKYQICAPLMYILKKPRKMRQRDYITSCRARDFLNATSHQKLYDDVYNI